MQTIKLVVVGDGDAGKHELLLTYTGTTLKEEHIPTVFDNYAVTVMIGGEAYTLGMFNTASQEDYDRLRPLSYPQTDVFLVCFSVVSPSSFQNVTEKMQTIKLVVVGDGDSGKHELLLTYTRTALKEGYIPTVFDEYLVPVNVGGEAYTLAMSDTFGQEDYSRLRPLSYPNTDVFLVCFSVVSPSSFHNVTEKWVPEISHYCPGTPFLLVGTQVHLRDDSDTLEKLAQRNHHAVTFERGEEVARELKAVKYVECSAETQEGLKNVFDEAILAALEPPDTKSKKLCILL